MLLYLFQIEDTSLEYKKMIIHCYQNLRIAYKNWHVTYPLKQIRIYFSDLFCLASTEQKKQIKLKNIRSPWMTKVLQKSSKWK